ncbi:MAG: SMC family ATPase, partial [bacterium]
ERQLKGKTAISEAAIYRNGNPQPEAVQERGVNEFIEQLLNLDYRSFFVSVFARQKDLAALSVLQPEERRKSIARLINIDAIDKVRIEVRADKSKKEAVKEGMQANIKDEKQLKDQHKEFISQIRQKSEIEKQHKELLKLDQDQLAEGKKNFEAISKLRDRHLHLKAQLDKWEQRYADYNKRKEKQIEQIDAIKQAQTELLNLKQLLKDYHIIKQKKEHLDLESTKQAALTARLQENQRLVQLIDNKKDQLNKEIKALETLRGAKEKIIKIDQQLTQLEQGREALRQKLTNTQAQKEKTSALGMEIRQRKEKVEGIGKDSPCPVCTRPLGEHYEDVVTHFEEELETLRRQWKEFTQAEENHNKEINDIDENIKNVKKNRDNLLREQEQFNEREKSRQKIESDLQEWNSALKNVTAEIAKIGKVEYDEKLHQTIKAEFEKLTGLHEQALKYEENVKQLPQAQEELKQIDQILEELQTDINSRKDELHQLEFDEQQYLDAKNKVDALQTQVDKSRQKLDQIQREIIVLKKDLEKINEEIKNQKTLISNIKQIDDELHYLVALDQHFGIFRQELAGRIRPIIAQRASDLLSLTTNGRYSLVELDEDYNIYLYDQTQRYPLARFSGGEQDLANLCLRIAISQVVAERAGGTQVNFIVLDEIFGSQDEERKELIMNTLQHLSSQFRQIFVITHVEEIKDVLPVVVSVEEKDIGESAARLI